MFAYLQTPKIRIIFATDFKTNLIINTKKSTIMTISQMQTKYDIIANNIVSEEVEMFNEDGKGTHTPSVYEYVKHAINNE